IVAQLPYGEPVAGRVTASVGDRTEEGTLDAAGRFAFAFDPAGEGDLRVSATVVDGAGRRRGAERTISRPRDALELAVIPEGRQAAAGAPLAVTVITTDGHGRFVPAQVYVKVPGVAARATARSTGAARLPVAVPASARGRVRLEATAVAGDGRVAL